MVRVKIIKGDLIVGTIVKGPDPYAESVRISMMSDTHFGERLNYWVKYGEYPKMKTRIRYKFVDVNNAWVSNTVEHLGNVYYIVLFEGGFDITTDNKVIHSENGKTFHEMKKAAKVYLQRLGVVFAKEVRNSKKKKRTGPTKL